jgi:hypothetical protein
MTTNVKKLGTTWNGAQENAVQQTTNSDVNDNVVIPFPQPLSAPRQLKQDFPHWEWLTDEYIAAYESITAMEAKARAFLQRLPNIQIGVPYLMATPPIPVRPGISEATLKTE